MTMRQAFLFRCQLMALLFIWSHTHMALAWAELDQNFALELDQMPPYEEISVIVTMKQMAHPEIYGAKGRHKRNGKLVKELKSFAETAQVGLKKHIKRKGGKHLKDMWIVNGLAVTLRVDQIRDLAAQPGVISVRRDSIVTYAAPVAAPTDLVPEWNLNAIHIPELWTAGVTGKGVVVATMDTGVDTNHPDISGRWRGGNNSWFDPHAEHSSPYDAVGHGTQVMGILAGGNTSGVKIGTAPDAQFIAAKIFNDKGYSTYSAIHASFQWLLDPDGNPDTQDAPDVVNASWGLPGTNNKCNVEFDTDIRMLKAANIAVVFAGGNDGPAPATGVSPANSAGVLSAGSVGSSLDTDDFSSRGPSPCTNGIFPSLVAPGDGIYTTDLTSSGVSGYAVVTGSSFAAPHVAGVLALLAGQFPTLVVADLENALRQTAQDLGEPGADNTSGVGLINANAALLALAGRPAGSSPVVSSLPPIVTMQGTVYTYQVIATDAEGDYLTYSLDVSPPGMTINASGQIFWIPGSNQVGQQLVTVRVTDTTGLYTIQTFVLVVDNLNDAPVANDDTYLMSQGSSLSVPATGILTNDTDRNSNRLNAVNFSEATTGSLSAKSDGSFVYIPPTPTFSGIVTFTYHATDGALSSLAATVTINVLPAAGAIFTRPGPSLPVVINPPLIPSTGFVSTDLLDGTISDLAEKTSNNEGTDGDGKDMGTNKKDDAINKEDSDAESDMPVITSTPVELVKQGEEYTYQVEVSRVGNNNRTYTLDVAPEGMTVSKNGLISWQPRSNQIGAQKVVVRVIDTPKLLAVQHFTVAIIKPNESPVAVNDSFIMPQANLLNVNWPGVLKNDTDADKNKLTVVTYSLPSIGTLEGKPDGSFSFKPPTPSFTGNVTFTYQASDGELSSNEAIVNLKIVSNRPPLANDDLVNARSRLPVLMYQPIPIYVLENDVDPDSEFDQSNKIEATTLKIISKPNKGGTAVVDRSGMINYTPAISFKGIELFSYSVKDTRNLISNKATVRVNVK